MEDRQDKFTEGARLVLTYAEEEAHSLNHNYIGTEHLLLGLMRDKYTLSGRVLTTMGLELDRVRAAVEAMIGKGTRPPSGEAGLTPRAKRVIELAVDEARSFNTEFIGTEHLLLGLIREGEGIAIGILRNLGIDPLKIRNEIIRILIQSNPPKSEPEEIKGVNTLPGRFATFNNAARLVLTRAQEEAQQRHHNFIGTEHLLLALVRDESSLAVRILTAMRVQPAKVRSAVDYIIGNGLGQGEPPVGEISLTPRSKRVIDLAVDEAHRLNHNHIGPEHLLLGMVREGQGIAAGVLSSMSVELEPTRQRVKQAADDEKM